MQVTTKAFSEPRDGLEALLSKGVSGPLVEIESDRRRGRGQ